MVKKIITGYYKARLYKKRLCDVRVVVWNEKEKATIEYLTYNEYYEVKKYLQE